jgi:alpha-N-arabinofuranosidase
MILTPTYHVFDMYQVHQDAVKLPVYVEGESVGGINAVSASASVDSEGRFHVSLTNIDPSGEKQLDIDLGGTPVKTVSGKIISSEHIQDHNSFDRNDRVTLREFSGAAISPRGITLTLPAKSVVTLEIV